MQFIVKTAAETQATPVPAQTTATQQAQMAVARPAPSAPKPAPPPPAGQNPTAQQGTKPPAPVVVETQPGQPQGQPQPAASLRQKTETDPNLKAAISWLLDLQKAAGSLRVALSHFKTGTADIPAGDQEIGKINSQLSSLRATLDTAFKEYFGQ